MTDDELRYDFHEAFATARRHCLEQAEDIVHRLLAENGAGPVADDLVELGRTRLVAERLAAKARKYADRLADPDVAPPFPQEARLVSLALMLAAEAAGLRRATAALPPERLLLSAAAALPVAEAATLLVEATAAAVERAKGRPLATMEAPEHREPGEEP